MIRRFQGHVPRIPVSCYVDESAQVIGDVALGEHSSVWMNAVLRGDVHSIRVGANSNVQDCAVLHGQRNTYSVTVGDWVRLTEATASASVSAARLSTRPSAMPTLVEKVHMFSTWNATA